MMYVQDYDEIYPNAYVVVPSSETAPGGDWVDTLIFWPQIVYPYFKNTGVFTCPSMAGYKTTPYLGHYGANGDVIRTPGSTSRTLAELAAPASTYMAMDAGPYTVSSSTALSPSGNFWYIPGAGEILGIPATPMVGSYALSGGLESDFTRGRHFNGINVCFADGHVKSVKSSAVITEARKNSTGVANAWNGSNPAY
jgi:prepilin-type processing-associated H-X9-DG protein